MTLGKKLALHRKAVGLSQEEVALKIRVSTKTLANLPFVDKKNIAVGLLLNGDVFLTLKKDFGSISPEVFKLRKPNYLP